MTRANFDNEIIEKLEESELLIKKVEQKLLTEEDSELIVKYEL